MTHGFRNSGFARRSREQYLTQHWCTKALLKVAPIERLRAHPVWEPAAGAGDIALVLQEEGIDTYNTDIDTSNFNSDIGHITAENFLMVKPTQKIAREYSGIITNPPYGGEMLLYDGVKVYPAEAFIRHSLAMGVDYVAMLLRTDFNHGQKRTDLFTGPPFAYEVVLTSRPRWDWWYEKDPWEESKAPMHNFSWFVWDRKHEGPSTQYWVGPKDLGEPDDYETGDL